MKRVLIIDGVRYVSMPLKKNWKVLKYTKGKRGKKFIQSVQKLSNGEVFSIGDDIALTWYETFTTPHVIKEFIVNDTEIYLRYGDDGSKWELSNARTVTKEEINNAIGRAAIKVQNSIFRNQSKQCPQ